MFPLSSKQPHGISLRGVQGVSTVVKTAPRDVITGGTGCFHCRQDSPTGCHYGGCRVFPLSSKQPHGMSLRGVQGVSTVVKTAPRDVITVGAGYFHCRRNSPTGCHYGGCRVFPLSSKQPHGMSLRGVQGVSTVVETAPRDVITVGTGCFHCCQNSPTGCHYGGSGYFHCCQNSPTGCHYGGYRVFPLLSKQPHGMSLRWVQGISTVVTTVGRRLQYSV